MSYNGVTFNFCQGHQKRRGEGSFTENGGVLCQQTEDLSNPPLHLTSIVKKNLPSYLQELQFFF